MRIGVVGPGAIGSTFAFLLSRAGHEVHVVARGRRRDELLAAGAVVRVDGARAPVEVHGSVAQLQGCELVLVPVRGEAIDGLLPALAACDAKTVMFMFNTYGGTARLRDAVGEARFAWGFPAVVARLVAGRLEARVVPRALSFAQITTVWGRDAQRWVALFEAAGVPTVAHQDVDAWLQTHAAFMGPLMCVPAAVTWNEARRLAEVMHAQLTRLGPRVTPASLRLLRALPRVLVAGVLFMLARTPQWRAFESNAAEGRWLLAAMER
ncbi:MAG: ketopantoate reductase family protein [Myxococcota bacterium]